MQWRFIGDADGALLPLVMVVVIFVCAEAIFPPRAFVAAPIIYGGKQKLHSMEFISLWI